MEFWGNYNLFASEFVIGGRECKTSNKNILESGALQKWLHFKATDWGMEKYHPSRTQSVAFLTIIDLEDFKTIIGDIYSIYKKEYPYSKMEDFVNDVLFLTKVELERFLNYQLRFFGSAPNDDNFIFYTEYSHSDGEFLDFAINKDFNIKHYCQFYRAVLEFINSLTTELIVIEQTKNSEVLEQPLNQTPLNLLSKDENKNPDTFDELFYKPELIIPCIDILKELDPPLIDSDYNYIGKLKSVICVWIDEMKRQGIVKSNYPNERQLLADLIPQKIKRFTINESMFGKFQPKAEHLYRTDIKTKVSAIKLSQNSH